MPTSGIAQNGVARFCSPSTAFTREGSELDVSTLANGVGAAAATLMLMDLRARRPAVRQSRTAGDDLLFLARSHIGASRSASGLLAASHAGRRLQRYNRLYEPDWQRGPVVEAGGSHAQPYFFDLARLNKAPIGIEASLGAGTRHRLAGDTGLRVLPA
jgi:hypothetical protein